MLTCTTFEQDETRRQRPSGLNTVQMLQAASSALGMGPHHSMAIAERLYMQGLISYPRTESTKYPDAFDFDAVLGPQHRHPLWGAYVMVRFGVMLPLHSHQARRRCGMGSQFAGCRSSMSGALSGRVGASTWVTTLQ